MLLRGAFNLSYADGYIRNLYTGEDLGKINRERVEIPLAKGTMPALYTRAEGPGPHPVVVYCNGLDSCKELLYWSRLPEARVGHWGGFVFINPSPDGPSLEEFLAPLPEHFKDWDIANRYVAVHVAKELPCNWKTAQEAFLESYHVLETHPQLLKGVGDANVQYDCHSDHVTRFYAASGVNSPHLANPLSEEELLATMILGDKDSRGQGLTVGPGETARTVMARHLRKVMGEAYRCDLSHVSDSEILDCFSYTVFPNCFLFPGISLPMVYRFRPNPDNHRESLYEVMFLRPRPTDGTPVARLIAVSLRKVPEPMRISRAAAGERSTTPETTVGAPASSSGSDSPSGDSVSTPSVGG